MSYSKAVPPFMFDSLYYLNRDQLERFSIICRSLNNFIERYFNSRPYRIFDYLDIHGGSYKFRHNYVQWHPNRVDYSVKKFLAGQKCGFNKSQPKDGHEYYCFAEMHPYLGPTVRIKNSWINIAVDSIYNPEYIAEMESLAHLWSDHNVFVWNVGEYGRRLGAEVFHPILGSPTILKCRKLHMVNAQFSFKVYKVLYAVGVIEIHYNNEKIDSNSWPQFFEQSRVKPIVVLRQLHRESVADVLYLLSKAFSSSVLPNAFKVVFVQEKSEGRLAEFRETNNTSGEKLELKKDLPAECQNEWMDKYENYTLERSSI